MQEAVLWGYGVGEKPDARKTPRNPQGLPQMRPLAIVERVPELAIYCNHIGDYPNYHHRTSNLMEADTEIYSQALSQALGALLKKGRRGACLKVMM